MLLPGHHYIGPGNPVPNGRPVDQDDRIALLHDIRYNRARNTDDIRSADRQAIQLFFGDFASHHNWHSAIGALGLGIKYLGESVFGVQYPRSFGDKPGGPDDVHREFLSIDKTGTSTSQGEESGYVSQAGTSSQGETEVTMTGVESEAPSAKRPRTEEESKEEDKKKGGGGATDPASTVIHRPINNFKTGKIVISHSRFMFSYGYQYKCVEAALKGEDSGVQYLLCTPFARVPCHGLPFYMTKTEFSNLPIGSQGAIFTCQVQPLGFRTPFVTNSAGINNVNSNLLVHGVHAHGLNNKYNGTNLEYKSTSSAPMIITEAKHRDDNGICISDYWGDIQKAGSTTVTFNEIPACFGNNKPLRTYYAQNIDKGVGLPTVPDIMTDLHVYDMVNGDGNPAINWEYRPQVCVLKTSEPYPHYRSYVSNKSTSFIYGTKVPFATAAQVKIESDHMQQSMGTTVNNFTKKSVTIPYTTEIEQCGVIMHGFNEYAGGLQPPSLHVGVLPVNAYSIDMEESAVQEVIAIYKVTTMCEIQYSFDFTYPNGTYVHPVMKVMGTTDPVDSAKKDSHYNEFAYGYRSFNPTT